MPSESSVPLFVLPKLRLKVYPSELRRFNEDGTLLLRMPLSAIAAAAKRQRFDPTMLVGLVAGLAITGIGWLVSQYNWLSVILYVLAVPLFLIAIFGCTRRTIVLKTDQGTIVLYAGDDQPDDVACFVSSLSQVLAEKNRR